ncbi:MAG: TetR/AcrR family transcriptional regulator [Vicinamibacterales bacterium]
MAVALKARKQREREEVRRAILDAARRLFIEGGYGNVPIRRVAQAIDYSPAALYRYFPTKEDIFNALAEEGFALLARRDALPACPPDAPPLEQLRHFYWGIYEFAKRYPEYFYLIFLDKSAPRLRADSHAMRMAEEFSSRWVDSLIAKCVAAGELPRGIRPGVPQETLSTAMYGVAARYVCDRLAVGVDADAQARAVLEMAFAGLKAGALGGVRLDAPPSPARRRSTTRRARSRRR